MKQFCTCTGPQDGDDPACDYCKTLALKTIMSIDLNKVDLSGKKKRLRNYVESCRYFWIQQGIEKAEIDNITSMRQAKALNDKANTKLFKKVAGG